MQDRLDVISNNIANVNNNGYKTKTAPFQELIQRNIHAPEDDATNLRSGVGSRVIATRTNFSFSSLNTTEKKTDYALTQDNTFFEVQDPKSGNITFTRSGEFHWGTEEDGTVYLMNLNNKYVLDSKGQPITMTDAEDLTSKIRNEQGEEGSEETGEDTEETAQEIGVYTMAHPSRLLSTGNNEYEIAEGDTENEPTAVENPGIIQGALETSGVDLASEMVNMIETQRAFTYVLKMIQTSDEVEGTVNQLRS